MSTPEFDREETFSSPFLYAPDKGTKAGVDTHTQHDLLMSAWKRFMQDPFERSTDLRGHRFEVIFHHGGLHVTIRHKSGN